MELSRLLRRGLFVAAVAAAGWLLSVVFAATAGADEAPTDETHTQKQQSGGGLLGGLVGGLTGVLGGVTDKLADIPGSLVDTSGDILAPIAPPAQEPVVDLPSTLPSTLPAGSSSGSATTDRSDGGSRADTTVVPQVAAPAAPVVTPPPAAVVPPAAPVHMAPVVAVPLAPAQPTQDASAATEHAGEGDPQPGPVKAPAAPSGSGTTASQTHDHSGGARGAHGVLPAQTTLHPADAGFTTRSRAVNAAGRVAGLPASSPD